MCTHVLIHLYFIDQSARADGSLAQNAQKTGKVKKGTYCQCEYFYWKRKAL